MNATVLQTKATNLINDFGNSVVYYAPLTSASKYSNEGDWNATTIYATTSTSTKWIQSKVEYSNKFTEFGQYDLKENEVLMKGTENIVRGGKCVSGGVDWEIRKIKPIIIKDVTIIQVVELKNINNI